MQNVSSQKIRLYLPAVISGILTVLSFPIFNFYLLAWIAFIPLLISLWDKKPEEAFYSGLSFGFIYFFGTLYWIYHSINHFGGVSFFSSIVLVLFLSVFLGLYPAVFSSLFSIAIRKTKLPALFIAPVFWVFLEFIRSYALTGFPWASIGYSQYEFLSLIQISDITGIYGISFLILSLNGAFADIFLVKQRLKRMPLFPMSYTISGAVLLSAILIFSFGYGTWRLSQDRPGKSVAVAVIQGNIEQDRKWEPAFQAEVMDTYRDLTLNASLSRPSLIIWPETAVPFFFNADRHNSDQLIQFQKQTGVYLLFGSVLVKKQSPEKTDLTNSAILLDPEGNTAYQYDKIHLVPFGEYVPLRSILFFIEKLVAGIGDYLPGKQYLRAETEFGSFGVVICYEIIFPGLVRKFYTNGGDFMVTLTNDAWFGKTAGPYQHFSMAVFRAIENRKPLVRAANTGISGFIDSNGRIISKSALFQKQILSGTIRTDSTRTFYAKFGDLFSYLCIVISVVLCINLFSRR